MLFFFVDNSNKMPGENCAIFGCGSCKSIKGLGILKIPSGKDKETMTWRHSCSSYFKRQRA